MKITKKSLWIDPNQNTTVKHGKERAFGFVGTRQTDDYQGWFFTWPSLSATISTVAEREAVLDSLEADETCQHDPQIPYRFARQTLANYLRKNFDLRRKS